MKRATLACLAVLFMLSMSGSAVASTLEPVTNLQVHYLGQNNYVTMPVPNPSQPDAYGPDITARITWDLPAGSTASTVVVGMIEVPFIFDGPTPLENLPGRKLNFVPATQRSVEVTVTPLVVANYDYDYQYNVQAWAIDATVISAETALPGALVTSTPSPVFNLKTVGGSLAWDNFLPVSWTNLNWVRASKSGQGGPVGAFNTTVTQDGAPFATATLDGSATNWPLPTLPAGHSYVLAVSRTFEGKTSPAVSTSVVVPAPTVATSASLAGPSSVKKSKWFTISGRVASKGTGTMRVQQWLLKKGRWVSQGNVYAKLSGNAWHLSVRLKTKGSWRLRAFYPGSGGVQPTAPSTSGYKTIKVK